MQHDKHPFQHKEEAFSNLIQSLYCIAEIEVRLHQSYIVLSICILGISLIKTPSIHIAYALDEREAVSELLRHPQFIYTRYTSSLFIRQLHTHTPDPSAKHNTNKTLTYPSCYYVGRCACVSPEMSEFVLKMYAPAEGSTLNKAHCLTVGSSPESAEIVLLRISHIQFICFAQIASN